MDIFYINHKFADTVLIPIGGLSPNMEWLMKTHRERLNTTVITRDNIRAKVKDYEHKPIMFFEDFIKERYHMSPWEFLKMWIKRDPEINSFGFIKLVLEKEE